MYSLLLVLLEAKGLSRLAPIAAYAIYLTIGVMACVVVRKIVNKSLTKFFTKITAKTESRFSNWVTVLIKNNFFARLSNLTIPIILSFIAWDIAMHPVFWSRVISTLLVVIIVFLIDSFIRSVGDIYSRYDVSKTFPLRGILQVLEIVVFVVGAIILVSVFVDRNPAALLGGIGAMTAIITIVFKDAILGFIAGIQLTANDMVRVGETIEFPQRKIIGTVLDISLITVKVEDFDKTIVAIPTYTFISEPFVNRRGMIAANARRIMRSFHIDANTVQKCDDEMIAKFKNIPLIADYVKPGMTNTGIFREYLNAYLRSREDLNQDLTIMVRQLQAADIGIPFEIYAFANATQLVPFENIQSDIFDHVYSVLPAFGLKLYQRLSGNICAENPDILA